MSIVLNTLPPADAITTSALPSGYMYDNGQNGIGATITGGSNGPLLSTYTDGVLVGLGSIVLVINEPSAGNLNYNNGLYVVTQVGVNLVSPFILTRHPNMCTSEDFIGK